MFSQRAGWVTAIGIKSLVNAKSIGMSLAHGPLLLVANRVRKERIAKGISLTECVDRFSLKALEYGSSRPSALSVYFSPGILSLSARLQARHFVTDHVHRHCPFSILVCHERLAPHLEA